MRELRVSRWCADRSNLLWDDDSWKDLLRVGSASVVMIGPDQSDADPDLYGTVAAHSEVSPVSNPEEKNPSPSEKT